MPRTLTDKRWHILPEDITPEDITAEAHLQIELGVHPVIARLLVQRGLRTPEAADRFLKPTLDGLHDPFLLPDAEVACERIKVALAKGEHIRIHGDYDGDGVTSAALWTRVLRGLDAQVDVFVPHRKRDGYDMRDAFIEQARQDGVGLIITTDCGIQRVDEVEHARQAGIDVIITDHHKPNMSGELPRAVAVVNPQRKDSKYPCVREGAGSEQVPHLAGVGVAFRLCEALILHLDRRRWLESYRSGYLDLAAIGTVTDMMPLLDENRIIVRHGLDLLRNTKKVGLRALIDACGYTGKPIDRNAISYQLGPRLNAASRMGETQYALDLLTTKDDQEASALARRLNDLNVRSREEQARILEEAMDLIVRHGMTEAYCLVVSGEGWNSGIVGIVASKIVERFHRPVVVISMNPATGVGRGSARSIPAFNMFDAIHACRDLLQEYGGHAHAAGLGILQEDVADFAAQMNRLASERLTDEYRGPTLDVATEIAPGEICDDLLQQIEAMAPFGNGNPEPLFVSRGMSILETLRMGAEKQHLKLILKAEGLNARNTVEALWWHNGELADHLEPGQSLDFCYRPGFNFFRGERKIQFMIEDLKPPEW